MLSYELQNALVPLFTGPCAGMCDQIVPGRLHEMKMEETNSIINEFISNFFRKNPQWSENPEKRGPNL